MDNDTPSGNQNRFSFALATVENNANFWDFGLQLYRSSNKPRRATPLGSALTGCPTPPRPIAEMAAHQTLMRKSPSLPPGTFGTQINFLIRVTDAGAESTTFNSRIQLLGMEGAPGFTIFRRQMPIF